MHETGVEKHHFENKRDHRNKIITDFFVFGVEERKEVLC
jgi:hypothetical protein